MNWFLYIITQDFIADDGKRVKAGEAGVGQCSMAPGISDAYNGIMYIVPHNYIKIIIIKPEDKDFFIE